MSGWENDERFDGLFANVATGASGIDNLLDVFFGFLERKTDFFFAADSSAVENIVLGCLRKHQLSASKRKEVLDSENRKKDEERKRRMAAQTEAKTDVRNISAANKNSSDVKAGTKDNSTGASVASVNSNNPTRTRTTDNSKVEEIFEGEDVQSGAPTADCSCTTTSGTNENSKKAGDDSLKMKDDEGGEIESDDEKDVDDALNPALHGNGGVTERYKWTQTLSSVDVSIPIAAGTKSSGCDVKITPSTLKAGLKGQPPIIEGKFCEKIKPADSFWTLVENRCINLTLEKLDGMKWWKCVVIGDQEIDTKKIVPENSKLNDLDSETRATVEKMMFDQNQKQRGLPTSDQRAQTELFDKFKKAHPEMDFSKAKVNFGGGMSGGGGMFG